jgi:hypothetical protein
MPEKLDKEIKVITLRIAKLFFAFMTCVILNACSGNLPKYTEADKNVQISPDYSGVTLPPNIAPVNFTINENAKKYLVIISEEGGKTITIKSSTGKIRIPANKWKKLLQRCKGKDIFFEVFIKNDNNWVKYPSIINHVAKEPIDSYIVYRLIDPGF